MPRPDFGPLPFLIGLANIGLDDAHPRGRSTRLVQARRFTDADGRRYAFDPEAPFDVLEDLPGGWSHLRQERDGVRMFFLRGPDGTVRPSREPITRSWDEIQASIAPLLNSIRPMMPTRPDSGWRVRVPPDAARAEGLRDGGHYTWTKDSPETLAGASFREAVCRLSTLAHAFLTSLWLLQHPEPNADGAEQLLVRTIAHAIGQCCLGAHDGLLTLPPDPTRWGEETLAWAHSFANEVADSRDAVWMELDKYGAPVFVSATMPGIAWAELLNCFFARPLWAHLQPCAWCGRFFLERAGRKGPQGPRREFCPPPAKCKDRFHALSPHERRYGRALGL